MDQAEDSLEGVTALEGCALCPNCGFWSDVGMTVSGKSGPREFDFCMDTCQRYFLACKRCCKSYVPMDGNAIHVDRTRLDEIQTEQIPWCCPNCQKPKQD